MKKWITFFALVLIAALVLGLFAACGGDAQEPAKKDDETSAQQKTDAETEEEPSWETVPDETEPDETEPEDLNWSYCLEVDTASDDYYSEDGTLLVSASCECPVLMLSCDGDADSIPPAAMQNVCDSFNETMNEVCFSGAAEIAEMAEEDYENNSEYFRAYEYSIAVTDSRIEGDLVEVTLQTYSYWGGAHGGSALAGYHFDLPEGAFFTLADLTDDTAGLNGAIAEEIIRQIDESGRGDSLFDGYEDSIRNYSEYNFSIGNSAVSVIFGEYEIASYAEGILTFDVPFDVIGAFLNERGARLLFAE